MKNPVGAGGFRGRSGEVHEGTGGGTERGARLSPGDWPARFLQCFAVAMVFWS